MSQFDPKIIEAVADAWASIDGKVDAFRAGKNAKSIDSEPGGHYSGYMSEAAEMIARLMKRGYIVVPFAAPMMERQTSNLQKVQSARPPRTGST